MKKKKKEKNFLVPNLLFLSGIGLIIAGIWIGYFWKFLLTAGIVMFVGFVYTLAIDAK